LLRAGTVCFEGRFWNVLLCVKKYALVSNDRELSIELTSCNIVDEEEKISYTTYGFRILDEHNNILFSAKDVDTNQEFVEQFIRLCAENDVRLVHIPELLEDYLSQR
jgi:hypothetical protein